MTEAEWLNVTRASSFLIAARLLLSERKVRLVACACARHFLTADAHPTLHWGVEVGEQIADGTADGTMLARADDRFGSLFYVGDYVARGFVGVDEFRASLVKWTVNKRANLGAGRMMATLSDYEADTGEGDPRWHLPHLRDIFGNPFRPVNFDAEWRTSTAVALAKGMYETRNFSAMPILADALQDAGCNNADILSHCRDANGVHVRGCWVVDLVLGKK
jgi:hypothetical protein